MALKRTFETMDGSLFRCFGTISFILCAALCTNLRAQTNCVPEPSAPMICRCGPEKKHFLAQCTIARDRETGRQCGPPICESCTDICYRHGRLKPTALSDSFSPNLELGRTLGLPGLDCLSFDTPPLSSKKQ
jgi:hypothetical protein